MNNIFLIFLTCFSLTLLSSSACLVVCNSLFNCWTVCEDWAFFSRALASVISSSLLRSCSSADVLCLLLASLLTVFSRSSIVLPCSKVLTYLTGKDKLSSFNRQKLFNKLAAQWGSPLSLQYERPPPIIFKFQFPGLGNKQIKTDQNNSFGYSCAEMWINSERQEKRDLITRYKLTFAVKKNCSIMYQFNLVNLLEVRLLPAASPSVL